MGILRPRAAGPPARGPRHPAPLRWCLEARPRGGAANRLRGRQVRQRLRHSATHARPAVRGAVGSRRRYQLPDGTTRALVAQRINRRVAITDPPANETDGGRVYLVERWIESTAAIEGLVRAYVEESLVRGEPAILVRAELRDDR